MYSFYNITFQGLGCAAWVRKRGFFLRVWGGFLVFLVIFLKNSTINVEFGTHLRKTAQSTNTKGRGQIHTREWDKRGHGKHKEETRGEGSPVVISSSWLRVGGTEGTPTHGRGMDPDTHSQRCLRLSVLGVGGGKPTREGLTPRRKSLAVPWSFRGCQQLRLCLGLVRALAWEEKDWPGAMGTVSLLLPGTHLVSRGGKKGRKGEEEKEKSPKNPTHCLMQIEKNTMQKKICLLASAVYKITIQEQFWPGY